MNRWRAGTGLGLWLVLVVSLWASDADPDVVVLAGAVAALTGIAFAFLDIGRAATPVRWPREPNGVRPPSEPDVRLTRLRHQMRNARRGDSSELHDRLAALAAQHPPSHPARQRLAADPGRRLGTSRELQRIIDDLEAR